MCVCDRARVCMSVNGKSSSSGHLARSTRRAIPVVALGPCAIRACRQRRNTPCSALPYMVIRSVRRSHFCPATRFDNGWRTRIAGSGPADLLHRAEDTIRSTLLSRVGQREGGWLVSGRKEGRAGPPSLLETEDCALRQWGGRELSLLMAVDTTAMPRARAL